MASRRRPIRRSSALRSRMSPWVAGSRSSTAPATARRLLVRLASAPRILSTTSSTAPCARSPVASMVRSTASRTASGSSLGALLRFAIRGRSVPQSLALSCPAVALEHEVRPIHLRPAAEVAERVLLPGDPHRALAVAQGLLDGPRMFNHSRGLWGYTGTAGDGEPLTVQSTGMGGPSAAIVSEELIALGARRLVRIGTCGALAGGLELGALVVAEGVLAADGTSRALGARDTVRPDPGLHAALMASADGARAGLVVSSDLFYDP